MEFGEADRLLKMREKMVVSIGALCSRVIVPWYERDGDVIRKVEYHLN